MTDNLDALFMLLAAVGIGCLLCALGCVAAELLERLFDQETNIRDGESRAPHGELGHDREPKRADDAVSRARTGAARHASGRPRVRR